MTKDMIVMKNVVVVTLLFIALAVVFHWWNAKLDTNILYVLTLVFILTLGNIKQIKIKVFLAFEFIISLFH